MAEHAFVPTRYYRTIGPHQPELRIADGDTVHTTTVDAVGYDARGQKVCEPGNPQTGPFYVEGAQPGDALAVRLDRLWPNRDSGWCYSSLAAGVVDPDYVRELPKAVRVEWAIERERATATLRTAAAGLAALTLPLDPMVGCFGVAPDGGQFIATGCAGLHGGNMDYRGFRSGATVYFPVSVPGALFFIGDGHAVQGDGETVGTGIETSFDVSFTVRVAREMKGTQWPRAEDSQYIMTVGNARPLDQALQHATTEMMRWLRDGFSLDATGASLLIGQCVRYEIGNVFDPQYTVVCKLERRLLGVAR